MCAHVCRTCVCEHHPQVRRFSGKNSQEKETCVVYVCVSLSPSLSIPHANIMRVFGGARRRFFIKGFVHILCVCVCVCGMCV